MTDFLLRLSYISSIILMGISSVWLIARGNRSRLTYSFLICQLLIIIWSSAQLMIMSAVTEGQYFFAFAAGNSAICFIGSVWLIFSLYYCGGRVGGAVYCFSLGLSLFHYIMMLTTRSHHLFYSYFAGGMVRYSVFFWSNICYTYICLGLGLLLICKRLFGKGGKGSLGQGISVAAAVIMPLLFNTLYLCGIVRTPFDITPLAFTVSALMILLATYSYGFLNVTTLASERALRSIGEGIVICDSEGQVSYCNPAAVELCGEEIRENFDKFLSDANFSENARQGDGCRECEYRFGGKNLLLRRYNHYSGKGKIVAVTTIISDVSRFYRLMETEAELSLKSSQLALERERNRIAGEVHDTVGHTLTMISTLTRVAKIESAKGGDVGEYLDTAAKLSSEGIAQLRHSINGMKAGCVGTVSESIRALCDTIKGVEIELCIQGEDGERYTPLCGVIYENCREAITNSLRHSGADRIDIILKLLPVGVEVYIFDNGRGAEEIHESDGLLGIRRRTENAGGSVSFSSLDGFRVIMKFPINTKEAE